MWHTKIQTGFNKWSTSNTGLVIVKVSRCGCSSSIIRSFTSFWVSHPLSCLCLFFHIRRGQEYNPLYIEQIRAKWVDFKKVVTQKYQIFSFHEGIWREEKRYWNTHLQRRKKKFLNTLMNSKTTAAFQHSIYEIFLVCPTCVCAFPHKLVEGIRLHKVSNLERPDNLQSLYPSSL